VPVYFLSYAHADPPPGTRLPERSGEDHQVWQFHNDLSRHVRQLVGGYRTGEAPGFIDRSMRPGEKWSRQLRQALRAVPVFVALLSADYVQSRWCAREWNAFSLRRPISRESRQPQDRSTIVPVWWSPVNASLLPDAVLDSQRYTPNFRGNAELTREYEDHGIYGLLVQHMQDHYDRVVWQLARHVSDLYYTYEVPLGAEPWQDQMSDTFGEGVGR
jgi:hypothetical protein